MTPEERAQLDGVIAAILGACAREKGVDVEWLTLEIEQVVKRGVFEAHRIGLGARRRSSTTLPAVRGDDE